MAPAFREGRPAGPGEGSRLSRAPGDSRGLCRLPGPLPDFRCVTLLLRTVSWTLARAPAGAVHLLARSAGDLTFFLARSRRRSVLANLSHAFPERDWAWLQQRARESLRQMAESAFLALALPAMSEERLRQIVSISAADAERLRQVAATGRPVVCLIPHLGPQEALCLLPMLLPDLPPVGAIYRPLDNPALNRLIREGRQRFGLKLFSRKEAVQGAIRMLRANHWMGVLFDQNSGKQGVLLTFLDRVASATELPAILASRHQAETIFLYAARRGFWRIELRAEPGPSASDRESLTFASNLWLENLLRTDNELRASWLWAHNRWKHQGEPLLGLRPKKNLLADQNRFLGRPALPRTERFFIRLPNWLGDVVMLLPLLRAIRHSRPDASLTVIGKTGLLPLVEGCGFCERTIALPERGPGYFSFFWRLRRELPDAVLLFTNSFRGDLEARLTGAPHRYGMLRPGKQRFLLTRTPKIPVDLDERTIHQTAVWEIFLRKLRLQGELDFSPVQYAGLEAAEAGETIGLICGTENFPAKRWPVGKWRELTARLLEGHPAVSVKLFGTANDQRITAEVAAGFSPERVLNLAGKTALAGFLQELAGCRLVISNDTGGMHLANAIGVPVAGLFGPTNPVRTGPIFEAPRLIIQPPGCPPTGGASMEEISVEQVLQEIYPLLEGPPGAKG